MHSDGARRRVAGAEDQAARSGRDDRLGRRLQPGRGGVPGRRRWSEALRQMKIVAVFIVILLVAFAATASYVKQHPLEAFVKMTHRGLARAGMARRTIDVDGNRVVYFAGGKGERTIVLVHGVNDQAGTWVFVVPALMKDSRVNGLHLA